MILLVVTTANAVATGALLLYLLKCKPTATPLDTEMHRMRTETALRLLDAAESLQQESLNTILTTAETRRYGEFANARNTATNTIRIVHDGTE